MGKGLVDKDAFVGSGLLSIGILSVPVIGGKPVHEAGKLVFHGDPTIFTGPAGPSGLSEAQQIDAIYAGDLTITTNTDQRLDNYPLIDFRHVQQTQGSANTTISTTGWSTTTWVC